MFTVNSIAGIINHDPDQALFSLVMLLYPHDQIMVYLKCVEYIIINLFHQMHTASL